VAKAMRFNFEFSNLCGSVYSQGNLCFAPDGGKHPTVHIHGLSLPQRSSNMPRLVNRNI